MNDEWAGHFVRGSNWIQISVNAATKETHERVNKNSRFVKVIDNIGKLIRLKYQSRSNVKIIYKYTIASENINEIAEAIEFADSLGCDEIAFGYDYQVPFIFRENKEQREKIKNNISHIMDKNLKIKIERNRLERLEML
jgi:MoaA/NifB/PqqE/SkfB family radical SAM enzyme